MSEGVSTHKWFIIPESRIDLLTTTKDLIVEIRELADEQDNLQRLKGNEELIEKLDEVLQEIHSQFDKISSTVQASTMVYTHLRSLCENIHKIYEFFGVLKKTKVFIFRRTRLRKDMTLLYNNLRHSCTQLMAAVSLELLGLDNLDSPRQVLQSKELIAKDSISDETREGHQFFYGINRSVNYTMALQFYRQAAARDDPDGMAMVALCYHQGFGVEKDIDLACEWLDKTLSHNHALGKYMLGVVYINKLKQEHWEVPPLKQDAKCEDSDAEDGASVDTASALYSEREELFQTAIRLFSESAEMGHTDAQTALGQLYELTEDYEVSVKWYEAASTRGCMRARNLLAMLYFDGKGVPKRKEKAYDLFKQAAQGGDACALNNVAMCLEHGFGVEKDVRSALRMYKAGADGGSAQSAYSYGYLRIQHAIASIVGSKVFPNSALVVTGRVASQSQNVERDKELQEGTRYLRIALEKGVPEAGFQIARLYEQGIGVPLDHSSAYLNYLWASQLGHAKSAFCAANMLFENCVSTMHNISSSYPAHSQSSETLDDIKQNMRFAASLYHQAATAGIVEAMNAYGVMLEDGTADGRTGQGYPAKAATWYHAACEGGLLEAVGNLDMLLRTYVSLEKINTLDGRVLERSDVLDWIQSIKSSPFIRQGDLTGSERPTALLVVHGNHKSSNESGSSIPDGKYPKHKMNVSILPRLFESSHLDLTFETKPTLMSVASAVSQPRKGRDMEGLVQTRAPGKGITGAPGHVVVNSRNTQRHREILEEKEEYEDTEMDETMSKPETTNKLGHVRKRAGGETDAHDEVKPHIEKNKYDSNAAEDDKPHRTSTTAGVSRLKSKKSEYSLA